MSPYTTVSNVIYNNKGDASAIKAKLSAKQKADLRTNHFTIASGSDRTN
jgi:hypothetical protein